MEIENNQLKRKPQLSLKDRQEIVYLRRNGVPESEVAQRLETHKSTVNSVYTKWKIHGTVENLPIPGRPKKVTEEEEKMLKEAVEAHPTMSLSQLRGSIDASFSNPTACKILKDNGYRYYTVPEKWALSSEHRKHRLEWAVKHQNFPDTYWQKVVFTDECRIEGSSFKQKAWVIDKTSLPTIEKDRWGPSVICWGAITYAGKTILECQEKTMTADVYLNLLKRRLLRNLPALSPKSKRGATMDRLLYQHDQATSHTAKIVQDYFQEKQIEVINWPPKSPDLNLIEAVWSQLKYKLKRVYKDYEELVEDVYNAWESIPVEFIQNLYNSMNRRILAVIEAKGGPTQY